MAEFEFPDADATEQDLVRIAQNALSRCNWVVGRCAAQWTERYARGRTDSDFALLVGLSADQVYQRRRVWETFGDVIEDYASLRWSHFYVALNWDDAPECLQWADENGATVAEMRAWRRASRGEDLPAASEDESSLGDDPSIGRLAAIPAEVRVPGDEPASRRAWDGVGGSDEDAPFVAGTVSSASRETAGAEDSEYAPFRRDAGSAPPKAMEEGYPEEKPAGQIARRVIGTLERIVSVLTPQIVAAFRSLPEKDRKRLTTAVRLLSERIAVLETQRA